MTQATFLHRPFTLMGPRRFLPLAVSSVQLKSGRALGVGSWLEWEFSDRSQLMTYPIIPLVTTCSIERRLTIMMTFSRDKL